MVQKLAALALVLLVSCAATPRTGEDQDPIPTYAPSAGLAVGEVGADRALIWSRADRAGFLAFEVRDARGRTLGSASCAVDASTDFCATQPILGLAPGVEHRVRVTAADAPLHGIPEGARCLEGSFVTAAAADDPRPVRFAWSGDLGGQNVGRDEQLGFAILPRMLERRPDFFVALGDMIYADGRIEGRGRFGNQQVPGAFEPSFQLEDFRAHWRYAREDAGLRELLARVPCYSVWDDHEVVNDFSPAGDGRSAAPATPEVHLMPLGLAALREYNPVPPAGPLYRSVRRGKHLELFFLDNRGHRDANDLRDDGPAPKTQLGREQRIWLERALAQSDATWRVVISSVPIGIPTGSASARDGWADGDSGTGFERELAGLFEHLRAGGVNHTVWLTTDVHFATGFEYTPFPATPEFKVHEFVAGPLSAGLFPRQELDPTFHPRRRFFHGPNAEPASYGEALGWFNFGLISIDAAGVLTLEMVDGHGKTFHTETLHP